MARADRFTIERKKPEVYSDFTVNLEKNPLTGLLAKVTNENAVESAVRNLMKTMRRERFNQPFVGSKLNALLFDDMSHLTTVAIQETINETIKNDEPRAQNPQTHVTPLPALNSYRIECSFGMVNIPERASFSLILKKLR